jgi:hypothetical protein
MLSAQDLNEWRAYAALEPFGSTREDMRAGLLAQMLYNPHRGKDSPALLWYDFFGNIETLEIKEERERKLRADPVKSSEMAIVVFKAFNARLAESQKQREKQARKH